jgi:probable rRNA maturation factor
LATIFFHYPETPVRIRNIEKIKKLITELFHKRRYVLERLDYIFCSDEYLLKINKKFFSRDYYTDIITFSLNEINQPVAGEVYISIERVKDNARKFKVSTTD